jgi:hypothetical protein
MDARRGLRLRAGFIVDKVETELSESLVVCGIVMSLRRQGVVV